MDRVEIFYFSGTGNSLAVARDIAEQLNAKLVPANCMLSQPNISLEADVIGFVFPIYDFKPPKPIENLICRLKNLDSKYLFAVCTYGITPAKSLNYLDKVIKSCGGRLAAGFAVKMPHNGIGSGAISHTQQAKMIEGWSNKLIEICKYIRDRKEGKIESSSLFFNLFQFNFIRMMPSLFNFLIQILLKGVKSLAFTSSENCNGCGTCKKICPVDNIELTDNKPNWSDSCVGCFACLHWCPKGAISLGSLNMNIKNYHHPDVKISDMIRKP